MSSTTGCVRKIRALLRGIAAYIDHTLDDESKQSPARFFFEFRLRGREGAFAPLLRGL